MKHIKLSRRHLPLVAAFVMVFSLVAQSAVLAAQITERSITLSSSAPSATNVTYKVEFTPATSAGAFVVDFCSNSPVVGESCTGPTGMAVTSASSSTVGFTDVTGTGHQVVVAGTITAPTPVSVEIEGITNPSATGPLYARIVTYDTKTNANGYASDNLGSGNKDDGGVTMSINPVIGVSGTVLETMTFCVSGADIAKDCGGSLTTPVLTLGETVGDGKALVAGTISTGDIYTQLTTNASSGAVVRLKSNAADCGGLLRAGSPSACDIAPALNTGLSDADDSAKFGVHTNAPTNPTGFTGTGTYQPVTGSNYNTSTYALNYVSGDATGVTSPYGDPFLDSDDAPINNKNMKLTFGATVGNNTPAGTYFADLNLIATGKF